MAVAPFDRTLRLASLIREIVADLLRFKVKDPRVASVSITDAEVTGDFREARVYYTVAGDGRQRAAAAAGLKRSTGFIRREVGRRVQVRFTPVIEFRIDTSLEYGARIDERLRELGLGDSESTASAASPAVGESVEQAQDSSEPRPGVPPRS